VSYCVVPTELVDLLQPLRNHYEGDPEMTVIVDRRLGERRRLSALRDLGEQRVLRDRRRRPLPGGPMALYGETGATGAE
jgi:hypothetical protein